MNTLTGYFAYDHIADLRAQMRRAVDEMMRRHHEVVDRFEDVEYEYDADRLGVLVGVRSTRPERLLREIKQVAFPNFSFTGMKMSEGRHWTWFRIF